MAPMTGQILSTLSIWIIVPVHVGILQRHQQALHYTVTADVPYVLVCAHVPPRLVFSRPLLAAANGFRKKRN